MVTRSRAHAAAAAVPTLPLPVGHGVLQENAGELFGVPDAMDEEVWSPVEAQDDVDDDGDLEYRAVLASATQRGLRAEPQSARLADLVQHTMVAHDEYHDEAWQPVMTSDDVDDVEDREYLVWASTRPWWPGKRRRSAVRVCLRLCDRRPQTTAFLSLSGRVPFAWTRLERRSMGRWSSWTAIPPIASTRSASLVRGMGGLLGYARVAAVSLRSWMSLWPAFSSGGSPDVQTTSASPANGMPKRRGVTPISVRLLAAARRAAVCC
mmetsp:Transcript_36777/g.89523  ORF Transcript_36777/g.89523 Transcript_36777/m.89523 type:complete len:265 (-) Transcript_36777:1146-1940(-)